MKKSRHSDEQIVRILRETDRDMVPEVARHQGVSEASIYAWRKRFGAMVSDDVKIVGRTRFHPALAPQSPQG